MSLIDKIRSTIREHELIHRGDSVVVGVSGGADSLTLLHALNSLAPEMELRLQVAHLNHQLRGDDSDADEQFVVWLAREWGLPVANARWDVREYAEENQYSIEEAARLLRYRFLLGVARQVNAQAIAVAHNADDQVESVLMHFIRGAGLSGLRGMSYKLRLTSHDGNMMADLVRPLLDVPRAEIEIYCIENSLQPRTDETNFDTTILRNRLRHNVIPYLETINPNLRDVIRHSALTLADDYAYIQQNVQGIFERMARETDGALVLDRRWFRALPVNLQRGVLRHAMSRLRSLKNIGYHHIEWARRVAAEKDAGAEATLPQGLLLVVGYDDFTIGEHVPLPDVPLIQHRQKIVLHAGGEILLEDSDWGVRASDFGFRNVEFNPRGKWELFLDADKIRGNLVLRTRFPGERFAPRGMGGKHKSLHEFMIDEKIPRHVRELIPLLADEEKILWVVGYRDDERAAVTQETKNILRVEFFKNLD